MTTKRFRTLIFTKSISKRSIEKMITHSNGPIVWLYWDNKMD